MKILDAQAATAVVPRPAATTLVLRDSPTGLEVLMVRRSLQASFMPGAYVFPGGAVDPADGVLASVQACDETAQALEDRIGRVTLVGAAAGAYAVAALRECFEECGLWLGAAATQTPEGGWPALRARAHGGESFATVAATAAAAGVPLVSSGLVPWSHWVTPLGLPKRFDTLFFVTRTPPGQEPSVDEGETTTLAWVQPPQALAQHAAGRFPMEFATVRTVESLVPFAVSGVNALLDFAASQRRLPPLHPRIQVDADNGRMAVLLPGQPGYETAGPRPAAAAGPA